MCLVITSLILEITKLLVLCIVIANNITGCVSVITSHE